MPFETPRTPRRRGAVRHGALGLLAAALLLTGCESQADKDKKAADAAYREKLAKAQAIFAERCKTAGVVIHRTVKDVEGIELKKVRPELAYADKRYFDPLFDGAAMAGEVSGIDYIKQFLMHEYRTTFAPQTRGQLGPPTAVHRRQLLPPTPGYRFVEVAEADGTRNRYSPVWTAGQSNWVDGQHKREPVQSSSTRYALDYEDLVDPADRAYWVAGTKLRVIEKQTGEVIAELTRFVIDPGFGGGATGRWPWQHVTIRGDQQCPIDLLQPTGKISRYFVDTVLIPKQGD
ncbi:MAG: hypothetical protein ACK5O3_04490 [Burkholderiales bacterium]